MFGTVLANNKEGKAGQLKSLINLKTTKKNGKKVSMGDGVTLEVKQVLDKLKATLKNVSDDYKLQWIY